MSRREIDVRVRFYAGAHIARHEPFVGGCAWSAAEAVRRLAKKLGFAPGFDAVHKGAAADGDGQVWRIVEVQPGTKVEA